MGGRKPSTEGVGAATDAVLVVDRRRAFAEALASLLCDAGVEATSAPLDAAQEACRRLRCATLLIDGDDPVDAARQLVEVARAVREDVRVLALVSSRGRAQSRSVAEVGADAAVSRQADLEELLAGIRGERVRGRTLRSANGARTGQSVNPLDRLTPRERQVLRALMAGGRSADIAEAFGISPHTVRTHVQNTFAKLAVSTRLEAASIAREAGLRPLLIGDGETGGG